MKRRWFSGVVYEITGRSVGRRAKERIEEMKNFNDGATIAAVEARIPKLCGGMPSSDGVREKTMVTSRNDNI